MKMSSLTRARRRVRIVLRWWGYEKELEIRPVNMKWSPPAYLDIPMYVDGVFVMVKFNLAPDRTSDGSPVYVGSTP